MVTELMLMQLLHEGVGIQGSPDVVHKNAVGLFIEHKVVTVLTKFESCIEHIF